MRGRRLYTLWMRLALAGCAVSRLAAAEDRVLYTNDFESPNQPVAVNCASSLDQSGINTLYGRPGYAFDQQYTVEAVVLADLEGKYRGQVAGNGRYALGMLGEVQDDQLSLTLDVRDQRFFNVRMDISSIDVNGCGGPFGVEAPVFKLTLLDSPGGQFSWSNRKLDEKTVQGIAARDAWTFAWKGVALALDARGATDGKVSVVFDLVSKGYAALDNLRIQASMQPVGASGADRDADGVEDAADNCPAVANANQANADRDPAGDACDVAPDDPSRCGDRGGDGADDCRGRERIRF